MCTPEHTYRAYVRQFIAVSPLQCFQARPHARRLTQNGVSLGWPRFQKTVFIKHRSNIDIHASLAVVTFVLFPIYSPPFATSCIYILPTPKLMTLLNSVYHSICSSEVDMLCFRSVMLVRSFTANKMGNIFVFVLVVPHIEMVCTMCCPTSDIHSTVVLEYSMWSTARGKIPSDPVALEGWSSVRDRTNSPSHEIWSYKRDVVGEGGRWTGVLLYNILSEV